MTHETTMSIPPLPKTLSISHSSKQAHGPAVAEADVDTCDMVVVIVVDTLPALLALSIPTAPDVVAVDRLSQCHIVMVP